MLHSQTEAQIVAALIARGFTCLKGESGVKDCWMLDDQREIQGVIFKCAAGHYSVDMGSYHSNATDTCVYDGDIGHPEYLAEFKEWIAKQTTRSPY